MQGEKKTLEVIDLKYLSQFIFNNSQTGKQVKVW